MKRIVSILILSLLFCFQLNAHKLPNNEEYIYRGEIEYHISYSDSTKQEIKNFWVYYNPKIYQDIFNDSIEQVATPCKLSDMVNFRTKIEELAIEIFGIEKILNKDSVSNIIGISFHYRVLTGEVYLQSITFSKDAYNLITDEEILSFIKRINSEVKMIIYNKDEYNINAIGTFCYLFLFLGHQ